LSRSKTQQAVNPPIYSYFNGIEDNVYLGNFAWSWNYCETTIDEIRISSRARSAAYMAATHANHVSPHDFYTVGPQVGLRGLHTDYVKIEVDTIDN
jgi:hypothetical protein